MTRKIDLTPQLQIVDENGKLTPQAIAIFNEIAKMLRDHEARIVTLEP